VNCCLIPISARKLLKIRLAKLHSVVLYHHLWDPVPCDYALHALLENLPIKISRIWLPCLEALGLAFCQPPAFDLVLTFDNSGFSSHGLVRLYACLAGSIGLPAVQLSFGFL